MNETPILICSKGAGTQIEEHLSRVITNNAKCFQWIDIEKEVVKQFAE